jgi:hypothetical protein
MANQLKRLMNCFETYKGNKTLIILSGVMCACQCNNFNVSICVSKISYDLYGKGCLGTDLFKIGIFKNLLIPQ